MIHTLGYILEGGGPLNDAHLFPHFGRLGFFLSCFLRDYVCSPVPTSPGNVFFPIGSLNTTLWFCLSRYSSSSPVLMLSPLPQPLDLRLLCIVSPSLYMDSGLLCDVLESIHVLPYK